MLNDYNSYKKLKITPFFQGRKHLMLFGLVNLKKNVPGFRNARNPVKTGFVCAENVPKCHLKGF